MHHADGTRMCVVNKRKAQWYVNRGLAEWIDDISFQLKFKPNGHGRPNNAYSTTLVEYQCVVCGTKDDMTKHHIVPTSFRKLFHEDYKSHQSHDVVLICRTCHNDYEATVYKTNDILCQKYLGAASVNELNNDAKEQRRQNAFIVSARYALEKYSDRMPPDKIERLQKQAAKELVPVEHTNWRQDVIDTFKSYDDFYEFAKFWRNDFIEKTNPQFMPSEWDINQPVSLDSY